MKKLIIIQARLGSSRLPRKVMMPLKGSPLLLRMIQRVTAAKVECDLLVATTTNPEDDAIRDLCRKFNISCYSGHPIDLLDRHYQAALREKADVVIKIPSDCPLIDPRIIDKVVRYYEDHAEQYDYVSNLHPATYPDGNDVEVMPFEILKLHGKKQRVYWNASIPHHLSGNILSDSELEMSGGKQAKIIRCLTAGRSIIRRIISSSKKYMITCVRRTLLYFQFMIFWNY